jgi:hypothetical protein
MPAAVPPGVIVQPVYEWLLTPPLLADAGLAKD